MFSPIIKVSISKSKISATHLKSGVTFHCSPDITLDENDVVIDVGGFSKTGRKRGLTYEPFESATMSDKEALMASKILAHVMQQLNDKRSKMFGWLFWKSCLEISLPPDMVHHRESLQKLKSNFYAKKVIYI